MNWRTDGRICGLGLSTDILYNSDVLFEGHSSGNCDTNWI